MVADELNRVLLLLLIAIDMWGLANGVIVENWVRKSLGKAGVIDGVYAANMAMSINAACLALLLAEAFVFPTATAPSQGIAQAVFNGALFFAASIAISAGLTYLRISILKPQPVV